MKLSGIQYLISKGIDNVWKNRMMAFASFCVLLVSLLLVGVSVLVYINVNAIIGGVEQKNEIEVYLEDSITNPEILTFSENLSGLPNVAEVTFYTKEEALEDMKARMEDSDMLFDTLGDDNPLPDTFRVRVADVSQISATVAMIQNFDHVDEISAPYDFVNILVQLRKILTMVMGTLIAGMAIVSLVMISSTVRTSVFSRREEIQIMKYVGAADAFIRFPFFVEGMVTGFFAGCAALVITWLTYTAVVRTLQSQNFLLDVIGVGNIIQFGDIYLRTALAYLFGGALIGAAGCAVSTRKYIHV